MHGPTDEAVHVTFGLTREQVLDGWLAASRAMGRQKRQLTTALFVGTGLAALGILTLAGRPWPGVLLFAASLVVASFFDSSSSASLRSVFAQVLRAQGERGFVGRHELRLDASGIREVTDAHDRLDGWTGVTGIDTDARYVFLRLQGGLVHLVPRSAFRSGAEADAFVAAARRWHAAAVAGEGSADRVTR